MRRKGGGGGGRGLKEERGGRRRGWDSRVLWQTRQRTVKLSREATKSRYDEIRFIDVIFLLFVNETCGGSRGWLNLRWWHPWWLFDFKATWRIDSINSLSFYRTLMIFFLNANIICTHWKITRTSSLHFLVTSRLSKFSLRNVITVELYRLQTRLCRPCHTVRGVWLRKKKIIRRKMYFKTTWNARG